MKHTLMTMAKFHYELGLIGHDEFKERIDIALWLYDGLEASCSDPRSDPIEDSCEEEIRKVEIDDENEPVITRIEGASNKSKLGDEDWIEFLCLGVWVFTKADPDSYPSVPHGHFKSQNKSWPKLNPYTGRVFSSKHQEDRSRRLTKKDMQNIWSDQKFRSFCREMIIWYQEQFPYYKFSVLRPLRMPRW